MSALMPNPVAEIQVQLAQNESVTIRLLTPADAPELMNYVDGLSEKTRSYFAPHPFDWGTIQHICNTLDLTQVIRLVATPVNSTQIIAYVLLMSGATASDTARYQAAGIQLDTETDCSLAPSITDAYQSRGLGGQLLQKALEIAQAMGKKQVILWGGVQADNEQAFGFYRKYGFITIADFDRNGLNYAMCLQLA
ncbi:GNAT family N-acetyltransferase [Spirosoma sp. KNUC1025]|uniref:GNAT family N-acetyltransferase n=1 Tax=Spirosoma sp. KNUC1025 TaxID=2894082 RepID=UPI00386987A3|nr:GNAT family N-acetyltransferase [Spirosoma sp. KNUC1025]